MKTLYSINAVSTHFLKNHLVIYPTESVYGIGCLPTAISALKELRALKERPMGEAWILLGSQIDQFKPYVDNQILEKYAQQLEQTRSLLHPSTWIFPAAENLHEELCDARGGIAIRLCAHLPIIKLCNRLSSCIVSTSANFRGDLPAKNYVQLCEFLKHASSQPVVWEQLLGPAKRPSQIKNILSGEILR